MVLQKLGKAPETYQTPGGYRLITLLPTVKKVIKALITQRVIKVIKAYSLLLVKQMGNREYQFIKLIIQLIIT